MPGMGGSRIQLTNPLVESIFRHDLFLSAILWILALGLVILLIATMRGWAFHFNLSEAGLAEPRARAYLRWAFGAIWLFDGLLQFQPSMPLGLANAVVSPATVGTPSWLHALMNVGIGVWNNHPIALAVGTAWIQIGIGIALLVSNGAIGRAAAAVSLGWASMIWLIGNGAGGIFSSTSSILFGWPGATFFYVIASAWLVVDNDRFARYFARYTSRTLSVVLAMGALLQCLPGREFWHGGNNNALTTMTKAMTASAQPHWLAWIAHEGGNVAGTLGGGFNLIVVLWLGTCAVGLWLSTARGWLWPSRTLIIGCLVFWVVAEDAAIFGGVATDVNSLIPLAVLAWCAAPRANALVSRARRMPKEMRSSTGAVAVSFAAAMIAFSVVSMGTASIASAEDTFFLAQNGPASAVNSAAPTFTLTDQHGVTYRLGEHPGHYTLLTFLDPVCWTDCPLLASQLQSVRAALSPDAKIDIVAVAADPYHETLANVNNFIDIHGLRKMKDFYFVTNNKLATVSKVWLSYGVGVSMNPTDKMSIHSDFMFIISPNGELKWVIPDEPLPNSAAQSSAVSELLSLLHESGVH